MKKILLLGGGGFIGTALTKRLTNYDLKVMLHHSDVNNVNSFIANILEKNSFEHEIANNQTIINLIGQLSYDLQNFNNLNILGGINLLNSCLNKKIKHIILISSIQVYGESIEKPSTENDSLLPKSTYGIVKMLTEKLYQHFSEIYEIDITILRLSTLYGPTKKTGFISHLFNAITDPSIIPICYHNGEQFRDLLFIDDAINGIVSAIENPKDGFNIFNISSGKKYKMKDIVSLVENLSNKKLKINYNLSKPDESCIWADNYKARKEIGFEPVVNIDKGIETILKMLYN